jgi:hypothetical protein
MQNYRYIGVISIRFHDYGADSDRENESIVLFAAMSLYLYLTCNYTANACMHGQLAVCGEPIKENE